MTDRWVDWVVHVHWSYQADGLVEVWQGGKLIGSYRGPNSFNDGQEMYLKVGDYVWAGFAGTQQHVSYVDEVRMGNGRASWRDVAPA